MKTALPLLCFLALFGCGAGRQSEQPATAAGPVSADALRSEASESEAAPEAPQVAPAPAPAAPPSGLDQPRKADDSAHSKDEQPYETVAAAERALARAKADLDHLALAEPAPVGTTNSSRAEKKETRAPAAAGAGTGGSANNQCENVCRALASMSRAASAVCRMDGESGSHCTRAKQVVSDSQRRVVSCVCHATGE